ncbi:membrane cofactor protein-like isoform X2 [Alligator mississippiensis]|uniref:membrane cofactor protein-like isoform X2 n=1 Tax=Alligator mississippiensis TaxID=8496 RepID=UPI002877F717|nr:membrane cofactor protein-like isoform X2 [Alligator mississippiensis]
MTRRGRLAPRLGLALLPALLLPLLPGSARGDCGPPDRLPYAELADAFKDQTTFPVNSSVQYVCRPGYRRDPSLEAARICRAGSLWSRPEKFCIAKLCGHPGDLPDGSVRIETDLSFGSTVTFSCNEGYRLIGRSSVQCVIDSTGVRWSNRLPECTRIPCLPPPDIENGKHSGEQEDYTYGASVTYKCNDVPRGSVPFSLIGEATIHCSSDAEENGVWSAPAPRCKVVKCAEPAVPNGRRETAYSPNYIYRSRVIMKCLPGYVMIGSDAIECQEDNTWHPELPVCQTTVSVSSASTPTATVLVIAHGRIIDGPKPPYAVGDSITIECDAGYTLHGEAKIQYVGGNQWKPGIPSCHLKEGLSTGVIVTLCIVFGAIAASVAGYCVYKKLHSRKRPHGLTSR